MPCIDNCAFGEFEFLQMSLDYSFHHLELLAMVAGAGEDYSP